MVASRTSILENALVKAEQDRLDLREQCNRLIVENDSLRKANIRAEMEVNRLTIINIGLVLRHGAATFLLQKFTRRWAVRVFCRALRREAEEHLNPTAQ